MKGIRPVVEDKFVHGPVQRKLTFCDAVRIAADDGAEVGLLGEIAIEGIKTKDHVRQFSVPVGNQK